MRMMSRLFFFTKQTRAKTPVHKQSRERESFYSQTYLFVSYLFVPEEEERRKRGKTIGKERENLDRAVAVTLIFEEEKYAAETPFLEEEERKQEFVVVVV